jgi:hypothetical protein
VFLHLFPQRFLDLISMLFQVKLRTAENRRRWIFILVELLSMDVAEELLARPVATVAALIPIKAMETLDVFKESIFLVRIIRFHDFQLVKAAQTRAA